MAIQDKILRTYTCDFPGCSATARTDSTLPHVETGFTGAEVRPWTRGAYNAVHCEEHGEQFRHVLLATFGFRFNENR